MSRRFGNRRNARGWFGGGAAAAPLTMYGGSGWDVTNRLGTATGAGLRGDAAGFWDAILVRVDTQSGTDKFALATFDALGGGFCISSVDGWGSVRARGGTGGGYTSSPTHTIPAGDVGKVDLWVIVVTPALVRLWTGRAEEGAGTAFAGYGALAASARCEVGQWGAGNFACSGLTIFGRAGGVGIPTDGQIQTLYDDCKTAGDIAQIAGMTDHLYSVAQDVSGATFPNGLTDQVGGDNMTFWNGASSGIDLETAVSPTFRW